MARYYFDIHNGKIMSDDMGVELPDAEAARRQVWATLPAMVSDREPNGDMGCQLRMDVRDESGKHLFHAALAFVVEPASS